MRRALQNGITRAGQAWFNLTTQERVTTVIVTGIFLLGAVTRWVLK